MYNLLIINNLFSFCSIMLFQNNWLFNNELFHFDSAFPVVTTPQSAFTDTDKQSPIHAYSFRGRGCFTVHGSTCSGRIRFTPIRTPLAIATNFGLNILLRHKCMWIAGSGNWTTTLMFGNIAVTWYFTTKCCPTPVFTISSPYSLSNWGVYQVTLGNWP